MVFLNLSKMNLSIIIPVFNESENISNLLIEISEALSTYNHEILVIDDSSTDSTIEVLKSIKQSNENLRILSHSENYGQSNAIKTGISSSKHDVIVTIDGDGQNDPRDIPILVEEYVKRNINYPRVMIAGYRYSRKDSFLKRFSSKYANMLRNFLLKDNVPDTGCGLKVFDKKSFLELPFFNHIHRYLPALFIAQGGKVFSVKVSHRPRVKGVSKYGFHNRFWVGIHDLLGVFWLQKRSKKNSFKEI